MQMSGDVDEQSSWEFSVQKASTNPVDGRVEAEVDGTFQLAQVRVEVV